MEDINENLTMEELLKETALESDVGSLVKATVVDVTAEGCLVDVGLKAEGFIPKSEFRVLPEDPKPGDTFDVVIKRLKGPEGHPLVSWREARERLNLEKVRQAFEAGTPLEARLVRQIKGGFLADVGLEAFLPASQIDRRMPKNLPSFVGQTLTVMVLEADFRKRNLVVSHKKLQEIEADEKRDATLACLTEGQVVEGRVCGITDFGAFVDIGGVEGLIRTPDISWMRTEKISDILKVGDKIQVKVLKFDPHTKKVALGRKQVMPHPWDGAQSRYAEGTITKGKVISLTKFGAFVELEPGIEGLIHQSEFAWGERWAGPEKFIKEGETVDVMILSFDRVEEKIALSIKRVKSNPWQEAAKDYPSGTKVKGTVTHIVPFGVFIKLRDNIEGLLRNADIYWAKNVENPKDLFAVGQEVELKVLEVDVKGERVSLGLKQMTQDPFLKFKPGAKVEGPVVHAEERGCVIEIAPGVEAYVAREEIPEEIPVPQKGEVVKAVVVKSQRKIRRLDLSVIRYERLQEKELLKKYRGGHKVTLGDITEWEGSVPSKDE